MDSRQAHVIYEFGEFQLDALRRVLSSRVDGRPVQLTGKGFDALLYMVERAGQLLDKPSLMSALWPDVVVEENNLTQTIHTLRRVLSERPDEHRFIVTVPGRGYRFVADVTTRILEAPQAPVPPRSRRKLLVTGAAAAAVLVALAVVLGRWIAEPGRVAASPSTPPSVAVLPFVDMSEAQDQAYFADGLSEEILNLLAQTSTLRVIARTSSFSFKGSKADIETIAKTLNVSHVLEGSVRKSGDRVRITAQLVDGATSVHSWSQTYDRDVTDLFGVQDDIAGAVAEALQAKLTGEAAPRLGQTRSAQAFERYLQGRYFFNRRGATDLDRAREYFEQALQIDPEYARAWAGLAGVLYIARPRNSLENVAAWRNAVERSLSLGPHLAEAHVRAAQYYWRIADFETSEQHCKRAIALNPSDPLVLSVSAGREFAAGRWSEGVSLQRRSVAVDPLAATGRSNLGVYLAAVGEWQEALSELEKARELSPTLPRIDADIARVLVLQQRFDEALAAAERLPEGPHRDQCIALTDRAPGQRAAADAALARLIGLSEAADSDPWIALAVAEVHAFRGEGEVALKWVARTLEPTGPDAAHVAKWVREEIMLSPFLRVLHADARWRAMLASTAAP